MLVFDLKKQGRNDISFYLALEEYLLDNLKDDIFFLWDIPSSIVIGRNQVLENEVNLNYVKEKNIPIYRRPSGGGAIFADENCFMYTFMAKKGTREELNERFLNLLKQSLDTLGLKTEFSGRNDLLFKGKKFSGTAVLLSPKGKIIHGTFLYDTDLSILVEVLNVDNTKLISKGIKSVKERVINLKPYLKLTKDELMDYLISSMNGKIIHLTSSDIKKVKELEAKYQDPKWIYGQNPPYSLKRKERFSYGSLDIYVLIKKNIIIDFSIKGDFFEIYPIEAFSMQLKGISFTKDALENRLNTLNISSYIEGANNKDLLKIIFKEEKGEENNFV